MHGPEFVRLTPARPGDIGDDIAYIQRKLGVFPASGVFDDNTAARIRGVQRLLSLPVTGELDSSTYDRVRNLHA